MTTRKRALVALLAAGALAAGCDGSIGDGGSFQDVRGVDPVKADSYRLINNVDGFPNLVVVCTGGVALVTTTREAAGAVMRVPELDRTCPGYQAPAR